MLIRAIMPLVPTERRHLVLAAVLVAAAAIAARAPGAIVYPLWQDEVASARILIEPTPWEAVARVAETESTPPTWYGVAWIFHWAGVPVEAVRWLSVLFGAAAAVLTLAFARRFLPLPAATVAGLVVALAWQLLVRGHELRAYSLYLLLTIAFAFALLAAAQRATTARLAALAGITALGLLTHYFFALALATGLLWLSFRGLSGTVSLSRDSGSDLPAEGDFEGRRLSDRLSQGRFRGCLVTLSLLVGIVPALVWLPGFVQQVENDRYSWVASFDALDAAAVYSTFFWNAGELYVEAQDLAVPPLQALGRLAILAVVLAGAALLWPRGDAARLAALLATVPVALASLLWLSGGSVFTTRNLVCASPFAAIAIAAVLARLARPAAIAGGAVMLGLLGVGLVQERTLRPPPYEDYADALAALGWTPADPVYFRGGAHRLSYLGSAYALRSPIGWYLPGHPFLRLTEESCGRRFFFVDGAARPVTIAPGGCPVPDGGYWFKASAKE
jgi:Dolichyl-phosphate-mannose-protein mannosyltransferase